MNFIDGENVITECRILEEYFKKNSNNYQSNGNTLMHYATLRLCNLSENEEIAKFKCKYTLHMFTGNYRDFTGKSECRDFKFMGIACIPAIPVSNFEISTLLFPL